MSSHKKAIEYDKQPGLNKTNDVVEFKYEKKYLTDGKLEIDESSKENERIQFDSSELNKNLENEKEPLFVEDRTDSFQLNHEILYDSNEKKKPKTEMGHRHMNACWNCEMTDHSLPNCPEPRNSELIAQNRHKFHMNKSQQQSKNFRHRSGRQSVRYFLDGTNDICNDFIPGKLSNELLEALNVPKDGIPVHVYRMRLHGYPSGWLEEAREEYSGISIFTAPNECLPLPGRQKGEENIFHCSINEKKLHTYPGFNAPLPENCVDDHKKYDCPEYSPKQNLKLMYERLTSNNFDSESIQVSKHNSNNVKTDLASSSNDVVFKCEINSMSKTIEDDLLSNKRPSSPEDGEITDENSYQSDVEPSTNIMEDSIIEEKDKPCTSETCSDDKIFENETLLSNSIKSENDLTPISKGLKRKFGDVKSEVLGTPVLKHVSPYENRPTHDQFAKGMVDMIDHENLPNAVGTFKKLKDILKDVRKTLNNLL